MGTPKDFYANGQKPIESSFDTPITPERKVRWRNVNSLWNRLDDGFPLMTEDDGLFFNVFAQMTKN